MAYAAATLSLGALNASGIFDTSPTAPAVVVSVAPGFTGSLLFQGTVDGTNYFPLPFSATYIGSAVSNGVVALTGNLGAWAFFAAGILTVKVSVSAYTSGTANITLRTSEGVVAS